MLKTEEHALNSFLELPYTANTPSAIAWILLQTFLEQYEEDKFTHLHKVVCKRLLDMGFRLPVWILASYKVSEVCNIYILICHNHYNWMVLPSDSYPKHSRIRTPHLIRLVYLVTPMKVDLCKFWWWCEPSSIIAVFITYPNLSVHFTNVLGERLL